jgi:hypothetical protein
MFGKRIAAKSPHDRGSLRTARSTGISLRGHSCFVRFVPASKRKGRGKLTLPLQMFVAVPRISSERSAEESACRLPICQATARDSTRIADPYRHRACPSIARSNARRVATYTRSASTSLVPTPVGDERPRPRSSRIGRAEGESTACRNSSARDNAMARHPAIRCLSDCSHERVSADRGRARDLLGETRRANRLSERAARRQTRRAQGTPGRRYRRAASVARVLRPAAPGIFLALIARSGYICLNRWL